VAVRAPRNEPVSDGVSAFAAGAAANSVPATRVVPAARAVMRRARRMALVRRCAERCR
jgi:hypothetical protein